MGMRADDVGDIIGGRWTAVGLPIRAICGSFTTRFYPHQKWENHFNNETPIREHALEAHTYYTDDTGLLPDPSIIKWSKHNRRLCHE